MSEVAAANDVRAVALMNLGIVELWSGAGDDAKRHLEEGLELARRNGRPYAEQGCLAHLAVVAGRHSVTVGRELAAQTLEILEKYGWMSEPIAPMVLATMATADVWQGRFGDAQPWLDRAEQALRPDAEPAKALFVRYARGIQRLGQGQLAKAVAEFVEAGRLQSLMVSPDPLGTQARGLQVQTLERMGNMPAARAALATASDAEREHAETRVALAAIHLAERDARGAIQDLSPVLAGTAPIVSSLSIVNAFLLDALARDSLADAKTAEDEVERALDLAEPAAPSRRPPADVVAGNAGATRDCASHGRSPMDERALELVARQRLRHLFVGGAPARDPGPHGRCVPGRHDTGDCWDGEAREAPPAATGSPG